MKILINDKVDNKLSKQLSQLNYEVVEQHYDKEELLKIIKEFDCIIVRSATKIRKDIIDSAKNGKLKLIIRAGVGLDNIDIEYAKKNGISVINTPNASTNSVAELTIAHILSLAKKIYINNLELKNKNYNKINNEFINLKGKNLGILGFGRIGQKVAYKAYALGMKVLYYTRSGKKEGMDEFEYVSFEKLLNDSDIITLHVPFIKGHGAFIKKEDYNLMKDGVMIINAARGGVINEKVLINAIESGKVSAAALDVFEKEPLKSEEILNCEKISLSPHIGGSTQESSDRISDEVVSIIEEKFKI